MQAKFVGRWVASGNNMTTGYPGSSFSFKVSGTHNVTIETSGASRVAYRIDDGAYVKASSGTVTITGLTLSTHTIKVVLTTAANTWLGANYATVSSITVDSEGQILSDNPSKRRILVFGDSISAGNIWINGVNLYAPEYNYCSKLSDKLNTDIVVSAFGGIGYTVNANGGVPKLTNEPSYIENISSTLVNTDTDFDIILILLGVNDYKSRTEVDNDYVTAVTGCITRIKAKYPSADIHALIPFNNNGKPSLEQVYNAQGVHIVPQTWYSQITFGDSLHPNDSGHTVIANNLKSYFENYYGSAYFKEVTMKRIDTVYIGANGAVHKATGTMADNPVKPTLPTGAIRVADVVVEQGTSTGTVVDNRDWLKVYGNLNIVNVKDYGAKGDGVADDTAAIQRAIDNNPNTTIYFPKGVYMVSQTIITKRDDDKKVYLELDMKATVKATSDFSGDYVFYIAGSGTETLYRFTHQHTGIHGGVIDCNAVTGGIRLGRSHEAMFSEIFIVNCPTIGMWVEESYSADCYLSKIMMYATKDSNNIPAGQIGLKVDAYDNSIEYVRTCDFNIGIQINGSGNWFRECHPLWTGTGAGSAETSEGTVGYDIYGLDTYLECCYQDKFSIGIRLNNNCNVKAHNFFDFHSPNPYGTHYSIYNAGAYMCACIDGLVATFNENTTNYIYHGTLKGAEYRPGYIANVETDITRLALGYKDLGICSTLYRNKNQLTYINENTDFNYFRGEGSYQVGAAVNFSNKNAPVDYIRYGVLTVSSQSWQTKKAGGNRWAAIIQTFKSAGAESDVYQRIFFGDEVYADGTSTPPQDMGWRAWRKIETTSL